jgi:hypothetical protein
MAHSHDHSHHHDANSYYLEQLFTIAICGALGGVTVMLWYTDKLGLMLHPKFHVWALLGGVVLLALVAVRAVALWFEVDEAKDVIDPARDHDHDHHHGHDHDHGHHHHDHDHGCCGHDHDHDHGIQAAKEGVTSGVALTSLPQAAPAVHEHPPGHSHGHDHSHDHGWAPWRYVVLILPVMLYFLNMPDQGFRTHSSFVGLDDIKAPEKVADKGADFNVGFLQLEQASLTEESRDRYEGKTVRLTGQCMPRDVKMCQLIRYKRSCCAADAVPLGAVIMVDPNSGARLDADRLRGQWVQVTGRVHFFQVPNTREYKTAVILYPTAEQPTDDLMKVIPPPADPFLNA